MNIKIFSLSIVAIGFFAGAAFAQTDLSTTSVDWNNSNTTLLLNQGGTALSAGTSANNDGALIQIGYYDQGTSSDPFLGNWVALTGAGPQLTTIGDDRNGTGLAAGRFDFTTTWHFNSDTVDVYDSAFDAAPYTTKSAVTIATNAPSNGQILSIRFYDTNTIGANTMYNAVSNVAWTWATPSDAGTNLPAISLTQPNLLWESVNKFGMAGTEFRTVLPIPEPSAIALAGLGIGLIGLARRRLRRA